MSQEGPTSGTSSLGQKHASQEIESFTHRCWIEWEIGQRPKAGNPLDSGFPGQSNDECSLRDDNVSDQLAERTGENPEGES
jgi:hypothetical protein